MRESPAVAFPAVDSRERAVAVLLPLPLAGPYTYLGDYPPGTVVEVPLGRRQEIGVVWGEAEGGVDPAKLRAIIGPVADAQPIPEVSRRFVDWVADYTLSPPGAVLRMVLSVRDAFVVPKRARKVAAITLPDGNHAGPTLSPAQSVAASALVGSVGAGYSATLLDGVTGSGKTEVYFEAIAETLRRGQQVLVLVPEIALTAQWLTRFAERFGAPPTEWHSELTPARRRRAWRAVADGSAMVVVGARSALFLPYPDLGLIVVDEEHEGAFKQEDGVSYNARDMAVARAHQGGIPVVLASATPSLETLLNVEAGRYRRLDLPSRHGVAQLPTLTVLDMRRTPPEAGDWGRSWLAPPLVDAVEEALAKGEQALLFLNRRGYAPLTLCRTCGHRMQCPHCTAWLVEHRYQGGGPGVRRGRLQCHHCGFGMAIPTTCPSCSAEDSLTACGPGVERIAEEAARRFPSARLLLVTSDTLSGPKALSEAVQRVQDREVDLLIGTQMLAKGLHFPHLTVVGVVDADLGLEGGDLRAAERTYQMLSQVAGRAGRGAFPGHVYVQTYQPQHPVMLALAKGDAAGFLATEAAGRSLAGMPPYGRLVALIVSGANADAVTAAGRSLAATAPHDPGVVVYGPAAAPLAILRGRHRLRLLLQAPRAVRVQPLIRQWLSAISVPRDVRIQVDIDPYSFL